MGLHQFSSCELLFLLVMLLFFFDEGLAILSIWRFFRNDWRWIAGIVHLLVILYNTYMLIVKQLTLTTHIYFENLWRDIHHQPFPSLLLECVPGFHRCDTLLDWKMIDLFSKHVKCRIPRSASGSTEWLPQSLCRGANSKWIFVCLLIYWLTLERGLLVDGVFG